MHPPEVPRRLSRPKLGLCSYNNQVVTVIARAGKRNAQRAWPWLNRAGGASHQYFLGALGKPHWFGAHYALLGTIAVQNQCICNSICRICPSSHRISAVIAMA
jgi:hypothetical protein